MSAAGLERVKDFSWEVFSEKIVVLAEESINAYQERRARQQEASEGEEARSESERLRPNEVNDSTEETSLLPQGNDEVENGQAAQDEVRPQEEESN